MLLEEILAPDYEVYNHFVTKFRQTLDTFTATRMAQEMAELDRWKTLLKYLFIKNVLLIFGKGEHGYDGAVPLCGEGQQSAGGRQQVVGQRQGGAAGGVPGNKSRAETGVRSLNTALHCRRGTETIQWMRSAG